MKDCGIKEILRLFKIGRRKRKWHRIHPNSDTIPMNEFDFNHVEVGLGTYGELNVVDFGGSNKLIIKNYVSIGQNVSFILNGEHYINHISTYPFKVKTLKNTDSESFGKGDIIVDDDVWIGFRSTILSGVHIGQGVIIAAGSVVAKDVPPYAVVAGVPAKAIKYRFSEDIIKELLNVDYSKLTEDIVREHIDDLYKSLNDTKQLDWIPKKV